MNSNTLPLLIEPDTLEDSLGYDNILIVDMNKADLFKDAYTRCRATGLPAHYCQPETGNGTGAG